MLFEFLKYINPTWYFNLPSKGVFAYFPDYDLLGEDGQSLLIPDEGYSSREVSKLDAAYQTWHKGIIASDGAKKLKTSVIQPTVSDNYRFIRKYFHPIWSWYVLVLRLFSLHNPIREIGGFIQQSGVRRHSLYDRVYPHETAYRQFDSDLVKAAPKVSVIIPTLNRYIYLKDALHDLEHQDYAHFDVIVVDQSEPFQADFYKGFQLDLKVIRQAEKALWLARNTAVKTSDADYLLLYDDDSRVAPDWISQHIKCLDYFQADISSGISISQVGAKVPENYRFLRWGDQLDTGNVLIKRAVFRQIGLFDRQFERQRMGDGEYGLRAYLAGFKNISNPYAQRLHLKVGEGGLRQMGSWDAFRPKSWLAPRPVPSVLYLYRKYFGNRLARLALMKNVLPSIVPYRFKRNKLLLLLGSIFSIILMPFIIFQVFRSWRFATKMLQTGSLIQSI